MALYTQSMPSPVGELLLVSDEHGRLTHVSFVGEDGDPGDRALRRQREPLVADPSRTATARRQLEEYFAGERKRFELTLAPAGRPFQQQVWALLQEIPFGELTTYGAIGRRLGRSNCARCVGGAVGSNPIAIVVPCHRVVGSDGSLTGYGGGLDRKRTLLGLEGVATAPAPTQQRLPFVLPAAG